MCSPLVNRNSTARAVCSMSLDAVPLVGLIADSNVVDVQIELSDRCILQYVQLAAPKHRCHSSLDKTDLYIAVIALQRQSGVKLEQRVAPATRCYTM